MGLLWGCQYQGSHPPAFIGSSVGRIGTPSGESGYWSPATELPRLRRGGESDLETGDKEPNPSMYGRVPVGRKGSFEGLLQRLPILDDLLLPPDVTSFGFFGFNRDFSFSINFSSSLTRSSNASRSALVSATDRGEGEDTTALIPDTLLRFFPAAHPCSGIEVAIKYRNC
eukprot:Hpha_TRINITY_DN2273_c0_g1::TRINITY_DN2273_c0_g1_i1::g.25316::m.25316